MITRCLAACLLLAAAVPLWADPPVTPAPAPLAQQSVLDGLVGRHPVIGFTERGGRRFLGRVISGDHGLYVVQTFHYTSTPATVTGTTVQTAYVSGRNGRLRPVTRRVKTQETTQKTIADDTAVRALLSGVAGPSFVPSEQPAQREIVAPSDVVCLQELLPPPVSAPASSARLAPPAVAASALPSGTRPAAGWTLKMLWASPDLRKPRTAAGQPPRK